eukprot:NODE_3_length_56144_cov_0.348184.p2 type:complete len:2086 gc:universal NODE_3_length_56144_cov_0.348184:49073-55330(+)
MFMPLYYFVIIIACFLSMISKIEIPVRLKGFKGLLKVHLGYKITLEWIYCEISKKPSTEKSKRTFLLREIIHLIRRFVIIKFKDLRIKYTINLQISNLCISYDRKYIASFDTCSGPYFDASKVSISYDKIASVNIESINGDILRLAALYNNLKFGDSNTSPSLLKVELTIYKAILLFHTCKSEFSSIFISVESQIKIKANITVYLQESLILSSRQIDVTYIKSLIPMKMIHNHSLIDIPSSLTVSTVNSTSDFNVHINQIDVLCSTDVVPLIFNFYLSLSDFHSTLKSNSKANFSLSATIQYIMFMHTSDSQQFKLEFFNTIFNKSSISGLALSQLLNFNQTDLPHILRNDIWILMNPVHLHSTHVLVESINISVSSTKEFIVCSSYNFNYSSSTRDAWESLPDTAIRVIDRDLRFDSPDIWMTKSELNQFTINKIIVTVPDPVELVTSIPDMLSTANNISSHSTSNSSSTDLNTTLNIHQISVLLVNDGCKMTCNNTNIAANLAIKCNYITLGNSFADFVQLNDVEYLKYKVKLNGQSNIFPRTDVLTTMLPIIRQAKNVKFRSDSTGPSSSTWSVTCVKPVVVRMINPLNNDAYCTITLNNLYSTASTSAVINCQLITDLFNPTHHELLVMNDLVITIEKDVEVSSSYVNLSLPCWTYNCEPILTGVMLIIKSLSNQSKYSPWMGKLTVNILKGFVTILDDEFESVLNLNLHIGRLEQIKRINRFQLLEQRMGNSPEYSKYYNQLLEYCSNYYIKLNDKYKSDIYNEYKQLIQATSNNNTIPLMIYMVEQCTIKTAPSNIDFDTFRTNTDTSNTREGCGSEEINIKQFRQFDVQCHRVILKLRNYLFPLLSIVGKNKHNVQLAGTYALIQNNSNEKETKMLNINGIEVLNTWQPTKLLIDIKIDLSNDTEMHVTHGPGYESALRYISRSIPKTYSWFGNKELKWFDVLRWQCHGSFNLQLHDDAILRLRVLGSKYANQTPIAPDKCSGVSFLFKSASWEYKSKKGVFLNDVLHKYTEFKEYCAYRNTLSITSEYIKLEIPMIKQYVHMNQLSFMFIYGFKELDYNKIIKYSTYVEIKGYSTWVFNIDFLCSKYKERLSHDLINIDNLECFKTRAMRVSCEIQSGINKNAGAPSSNSTVLLNPDIVFEFYRYLLFLKGNKSLPIRTGAIFKPDQFTFGNTILRHVFDMQLNVDFKPFNMKYMFNDNYGCIANGHEMKIKLGMERDLLTYFGSRNCKWLLQSSEIQWIQVDMKMINHNVLQDYMVSPLVVYYRNCDEPLISTNNVANEIINYQRWYIKQYINDLEKEVHALQSRLNALENPEGAERNAGPLLNPVINDLQFVQQELNTYEEHQHLSNLIDKNTAILDRMNTLDIMPPSPVDAAELLGFKHRLIIHNPKIRFNVKIRDVLYKCIYLQDLYNGLVDYLYSMTPHMANNQGSNNSTRNATRDATNNPNEDSANSGESATKKIRDMEEIVNELLSRSTTSHVKRSYFIQMINGQIRVEGNNALPDGFAICSSQNLSVNGYVLMDKEEWIRTINTLSIDGLKIHAGQFNSEVNINNGYIAYADMLLQPETVDSENKESSQLRNVLRNSSAFYYLQRCNPLYNIVDSTINQVKRSQYDFWSLNFPHFQFESQSDHFMIISDMINDFVLYKDPLMEHLTEQTQGFFFAMHLKSHLEIELIANQLQKEINNLRIIRDSDEMTMFVVLGDLPFTQVSSSEQGIRGMVLDKLELLESRYYALMRAKSRIVDFNVNKSESMLSGFKITADLLEWTMIDNNEPLAKMTCNEFEYCCVDYDDLSRINIIQIEQFILLNQSNSGPFKELMAPLNAPHEMIRIYLKNRPAVAGIGVVDSLVVDIAPIKLQMTYELGKRLVQYIFSQNKLNAIKNVAIRKKSRESPLLSAPGLHRSSSKEIVLTKSPSSNLDVNSEHSETESLTLIVPDTTTADTAEIEMMKLRSMANRTFYRIEIHSFQLMISYIGQKERNLEDLNQFLFTMPAMEYADKTWTYLDFLRQLRKDVFRAALSHTGLILKEKIMRRKKEYQVEYTEEESKKTVISTTAQLIKQLTRLRRGSEDIKTPSEDES